MMHRIRMPERVALQTVDARTDASKIGRIISGRGQGDRDEGARYRVQRVMVFADEVDE
jgi:hypothetical protein